MALDVAKVGVGGMQRSVYDSNYNGKVDSVDKAVITPVNIEKQVSDNIRNSNDPEVYAESGAWLLKKTFTLTEGIKGNIKIDFDMKGNSTGRNTHCILTKNGNLPGTGYDLGVQQDLAGIIAYETKTQDIEVDINEGGTIDLWGKYGTGSGATRVYMRNFRLKYDNIELIASPTT